MADISKCRGTDCPMKDKCWRYLAPSSKWQAYFHAESGLNQDKNECKNFIEAKENQVVQIKGNLFK
jgi:hypothetical protein